MSAVPVLPVSSTNARPSRLRRLVKPLVTPVVFDFWASRLNPLWRWDRPLAKVVEKRIESTDSVTLVLRPNRHWQGFQPGQHVNLGVDVDGARLWRSYSLTNAPGSDRLSITVKRIAGGKLSAHLAERVQVGDLLDIGPAFGEMVLPATPMPSLFLAAGSGITPLISLVRTLAAQGMPLPVTLMYWARTREELCFVEELRALAARHANLQVRFVLTRQSAEAGDEVVGRIEAAHLAALGALGAHCVYACGPSGFTAAAATLVQGQAARFLCEAFTPPPRQDSDIGTVQVQLTASGRSLTLPRGVSLLEALEAEGLRPTHGCRMGLCNTCVCGKSAGTTRDLSTGTLHSEPSAALKLCVSSATSDLVLEL
ncbi:MAG: ferredoxin reductase [Pseudoxanthomonas sp.]